MGNVVERRKRVAELWRSGLRAREIGEIVGASEDTVCMDLYLMRHSGEDIPRRRNADMTTDRVKQRRKKIAALRKEGWTAPEIAERLGEHPRRIDNDLRWMRITGVTTTPGPSDHPKRIERRNRVAELWLEGRTADEIAEEVGVRRSTVYMDLDYLREHGRDLPFRVPSLIGNRSSRSV